MRNNKRINTIVIICMLLCSLLSFSQESKKWFSTIEIEAAATSKALGTYELPPTQVLYIGGVTDKTIVEAFFYGLLYTLNYPVLKKMSVGAVGGLQSLVVSPYMATLKLGGIFRYYFVNYQNVNIYFLTAYQRYLASGINSAGGGVFRIGLAFPFLKRKTYQLTLNGFWERNYYRINKKEGVIEKGGGLVARNYGISLGIRF